VLKQLVTVCLLVAAASASALEVQEIKWGYNGKVLPGRLNPLYVRVYNPSDRPFEGTLVLSRQRAGGKMEQDVYVGPFGTRWVQFSPYVNSLGSWRLVWHNGKASISVTAPKKDSPCIVLLDQGDFLTGASKLPAHPASLFPASVSLTDPLDGVVLDHAPEWSPLQQQAFLDWLYLGGSVHLIKDRQGRYPAFVGPLQLLNDPLTSFSHGAGQIRRHDTTRRELTLAGLQQSGYAAPVLKPETSGYGRMPTTEIFAGLKSLVRVNHNWALIYFLIVVYMLIIGPGNYLFARKQRDYRRTIAFFVAAVTLFAVVFSLIGRRGYGERTTVNSMSYAKSLGDGQYDVTQWMNLFVTRGAYYTVTHPSTHGYYSTCQTEESVNARIRNGSDGQFVVDIPLYSSRPLYHRGKMKGPEMSVTATKWEDNEARFTVKGDKLRLKQAWLRHGNRIETLHIDGRSLVAGGDHHSRKAQTIEQFSSTWRQENQNSFNYAGRRQEVKDPSKVFTALLQPVVVQSTAIELNYTLDTIQRRGHKARADVYVVAETPHSFHYSDDTFGKETGYTVFHFVIKIEQ
jgi:hypothetical protein